MLHRKPGICIGLIISLFLIHREAGSQNLFANSGFEDINICTEYNANCALEAWFNIPAINFVVKGHLMPVPVLGHMVLVVPVGSVYPKLNYPRYVYSGLCCPLEANKKYLLSFFLNTANVSLKHLAFYFTEKEPTLSNIDELISTPSVIITELKIDAPFKQNWLHISADYTAKGNERFCIITNAGLPAVSYEMKDAMNKNGDVFYFIDEILLKPEVATVPCESYAKNLQQVYEQNYRHTDNIKIFSALPPPVIPKKPELVNDTIVIAGLLFDVNKADLKPKMKTVLDSIVARFAGRPFTHIAINGYTDNSGKPNENQALSEARALAIQKYLATRMPLSADKIFSEGRGSDFPVAKNDTEEGRQKNRRVEIIISYLRINK